MKGKDAVLCALGGNTFLTRNYVASTGTKAIIESMKSQGTNRLVVLSSIGAGPGNRSLIAWYLRLFLYQILADKDDQEDLVIKSGLDWTIVRPPKLNNKPFTGKIFSAPGGVLPNGHMSRADVAHFML